MKILFVHLTDIHLKENNDISLIHLHELANSLRQIPGKIDACCIIFSGDIAFSGDTKQYIVANKLTLFFYD